MSEPLDLGDQPDDWTRCRLKDVTTWVNRGMAPVYADADTGVLAFSQKCVRPDLSVDPELGRPIEPESVQLNAPARLGPGDVVVNSTGRGTLGRTALVREAPTQALVADGHVTVVRVEEERVTPRFLTYLLGTQAFYEQANSCLAIGSTNQTELGREALRRIRLTLPPVDAQQMIAGYLDAETADIDRLTDELVALIGLLWERRRAEVFDAVTGRSVPGPRQRGVPWVTDIPTSWRVAKLTAVARLGSGHTPARNRPDLWVDPTVPWITTGEVHQIRSDEQEVIHQTREMISVAGIANSAATIHPRGTVVLCRTAASAGYSALMGSDMATSQDFATWTCGDELEPAFLLYCLRAMRRDLLERLAIGSTHRTIYMPEIKSLVIGLPPRDEQVRLVKSLRSDLQSIDATRHELDDQIALLRERRRALITHAVTHGIEGLPGVA